MGWVAAAMRFLSENRSEPRGHRVLLPGADDDPGADIIGGRLLAVRERSGGKEGVPEFGGCCGSLEYLRRGSEALLCASEDILESDGEREGTVEAVAEAEAEAEAEAQRLRWLRTRSLRALWTRPGRRWAFA